MDPAGGRPRVRAADADRDALLTVLGEAHAHGRLDADEIDERQNAALRARYLDDLLPLVADLPEGAELSTQWRTPGTAVTPRAQNHPAPTGDSTPLVAVMSGRDVDLDPGTRKVTSFALMGGDNLDLTGVLGPGVEVTVQTYAMWAGHNIHVPEGVRVVDRTVNIMAGNKIHRSARGDGSNGTLILTGFSLMAGHDVKLADR